MGRSRFESSRFPNLGVREHDRRNETGTWKNLSTYNPDPVGKGDNGGHGKGNHGCGLVHGRGGPRRGE